jgi:hypothetical protein
MADINREHTVGTGRYHEYGEGELLKLNCYVRKDIRNANNNPA